MPTFSRLIEYRRRHRQPGRLFAFESLEQRDMPAVIVDVGYHLVEPDTSGQTVTLLVASSDNPDAPVAGFDLRAQIVTTKQGPFFQNVGFAGDLWNTFPHVESGSPFPADRSLASGDVAFTHGFEAQADGTLVKLTIDTTGIPAGSYEFRLVGTSLGSSSFRRTDGSRVSEIITNGTLHVRSIWQNPDNPNDINGDGRVSPLDVLLLLNELSKKGSHQLRMPSPDAQPAPHFDVDGDGYLSPRDPLGAINCLNGLSCVTSPQRILAKVTPDFAPGLPDSTSVGKPDPGDPKPDDLPPEETNPGESSHCVYYGQDENGNPIPIIDPTYCDGLDEADSNPLFVGPTEPENGEPAGDSVAEAPSVGFVEGVPATPTVTNLSPQSVDAAIVELTSKHFDDATSDELVDLGLSASS